jgi:hypothetical protein
MNIRNALPIVCRAVADLTGRYRLNRGEPNRLESDNLTFREPAPVWDFTISADLS